MTDRELLVLIARSVLRIADFTFNTFAHLNKNVLPLVMVKDRQAFIKDMADVIRKLEEEAHKGQTPDLSNGGEETKN